MERQETTWWIKSLTITLAIFVLLAVYLFLRRGYFNLYLANKVFGSTAALIAGITLLIGPLSHRSPAMAHFMPMRRHLGLIALGLAIAHLLASTIFQPIRFPLPWYLQEWLSTSAGLAALFIWVWLAHISSNKMVQQMGSELWRKQQQWGGKAAFLLVFLHLTIMKYAGWISWWQGRISASPELANPSYPPASLFVFAAMLLIIVYRTITTLVTRKTPSQTINSSPPVNQQD